MSASKKRQHIPGGNTTEDAIEPHIVTSDAPTKREKLPEYMDESQLNTETINAIVQDIQRSVPNKTQRLQFFAVKYAEFADQYPVLFDMCCNEEFDFDKFDYMMRIREQIAVKQRTIESASVEVGQKFYNMYMKK